MLWGSYMFFSLSWAPLRRKARATELFEFLIQVFLYSNVVSYLCCFVPDTLGADSPIRSTWKSFSKCTSEQAKKPTCCFSIQAGQDHFRHRWTKLCLQVNSVRCRRIWPKCPREPLQAFSGYGQSGNLKCGINKTFTTCHGVGENSVGVRHLRYEFLMKPSDSGE